MKHINESNLRYVLDRMVEESSSRFWKDNYVACEHGSDLWELKVEKRMTRKCLTGDIHHFAIGVYQ